MFTLSINMWFQKLMKQFFFGIDQVVFNFISTIYDLLILIARTSPFTQADIIEMADKIYKLLAVFMIFKVTFSLINYIVNPDDFVDKSKGMSKLVTNIIISLGMLILTPYIFNMAYRLQAIVLEDNTLANLIFESEDSANAKLINTAGDEIAFLTMSAFFTPNTSIKSLYVCADFYNYDPKNEKIQFNENCKSALSGVVTTSNVIQNYIKGIENKNLGLMFRQDIAIATDSTNDNFIIDYKYIFSTVVGVVIVLLLLSFCMDVALRSIKLAFLQLIAPIPILSYVDPKSGKDGIFKKWYQLCFKTYLSLFIRLLALYFAVYIISKVANLQLVDVIDGTYIQNPYVKIFIIIGALMFAKNFPKILEGLGIKLDGDGKFTLNPFKKFSEQALGGKQILGLGAAGLAGAAALGTNLAFNKTKNPFKRLGSAISGGISATGRGMLGAVKGEKFGKNFTSSYSGAMKAKETRRNRKEDGVAFYEPWIQTAQTAMGLPTSAARNEAIVKQQEIIRKNAEIIKNAKGTLTSLVEKDPGLDLVRNEKNIWDNMDAQTYSTQRGISLDDAINEIANKQKEADDAYKKKLKEVLGKRLTDREVQNAIADINGAIDAMPDSEKYSHISSTAIDDLWDSIGFTASNSENARGDYSDATRQIAEASTGKEAQHAADVSKYAKKPKS